MGNSYPAITPCLFLVCIFLFVLLQVCSTGAYASPKTENVFYPQQDTIPSSADTSTKLADTSTTKFRHFAQQVKLPSFQLYKNKSDSSKRKRLLPSLQKPDSLTATVVQPFKKLFSSKPAFKFTGGIIHYSFDYRSAIDTPYTDRDIAQHNIVGRWNFKVARLIPVNVNYWIRQSNSSFFRDIVDVQVSFNAGEFKNGLQTTVRNRLLAASAALKDTLSEHLYQLKQLRLAEISGLLNYKFSPQQLTEAREIIQVTGVTYTPELPDSINSVREDSLRKKAAFFLALYDKTKKEYERVKGQVDSLKNVLDENSQKIKHYREMKQAELDGLISKRKLKKELKELGVQQPAIPGKYRWLLGIRRFSVGRSPVNYSDLTAKNISVNGINVEYNSWYYLAVTAGTINYRYRDFVVNRPDRKPQFLYMVRAGLGRLERNYFIVTGYRGQKQLFAGTAAAVTITGISAETKWHLNRTTWLSAEAAKSVSPDFRNNPAETNEKFTVADKNNQAVALRFYSYMPATGSRVEGFYKKAGANFQSFSSFQTNAAMESWYIKAEQNFFNRVVRIAASLRKNEFSNPFIVQDYKSNTVFKSLTASFRMRKWPVVTVGYQPMSQLTVLDKQVIENRFQSLTATLYHYYNIKNLKTASTVMMNKFYNGSNDTGFIYYNATNIYWSQNLFFSRFNANIAVSHTKNAAYTLEVLDGNIQPEIGNWGSIGLGIKINTLNSEATKIGGYVNANIRVFKNDYLSVSYDHGYLPGFRQTNQQKETGLVNSEFASIQFIKTFNFR